MQSKVSKSSFSGLGCSARPFSFTFAECRSSSVLQDKLEVAEVGATTRPFW
jgi:hypothetical protein